MVLYYSYASTELMIGFNTKRSKTMPGKRAAFKRSPTYPFVSKLGKGLHSQMSMFSKLLREQSFLK